VRRQLSARSRLTLLYTSLFALGAAALVLITNLLVAHSLHGTGTARIPQPSQQAIARCVKAAQATAGSPVGLKRSQIPQGSTAGAMIKCAALYANGVQADATSCVSSPTRSTRCLNDSTEPSRASDTSSPTQPTSSARR
jgi:hypothetical protein